VNWFGRTLVAASLVTATSCGQDQAFRIDERVRVTAPEDRAEVRLPVTVRWDAEGIENPSFGVFVDRAPVRPGKVVAAGATASGAVYKTEATEVVIPELEAGEKGKRERHTATIVLLDPSGRRVGESAWDVVFEVRRDDRR
jgi:hypothetical protein